MTPARIMIVEDERITAEHLQDILTDLGYDVTARVSSGAAAIREAEQTSPDLVLMDIHIEGDMDGVETAGVLRDRFGIPAVYLTAHADQNTLRRAREAEPLGYIVKPFQEAELEASIEMALHKGRIDRASRERERRLSTAFEAMGQGVIAVDADTVITLFSPAAETWTGWTKEDAVGRKLEHVFRIVQRHSHSEAPNALRQAMDSGTVVPLEPHLLLMSRDRTERPISGVASPVHDHNGNARGAVLVFGSPHDAGPPAHAAERPQGSAKPTPFQIISESVAMRKVVDFAARVAVSEASTILLQGESGTGKDVLAKYLHYASRRSEEPFIAINCAAIPETLLESELFGYEKGAFTDARAQKKGTLELANGGTIFLDEIGELPLILQAKLLRVLEDQTFRRLGGAKDIQVDLRVVAATNRPLNEMVSGGRFRMDLYYRLNVIQIAIPPLRERRDDILPLANHFVELHKQRLRRDVKGIAPEAARALAAYDWPGNVRELRNSIERAMLLEDTEWLQPASLAMQESPIAQTGEATPAQAALDGMSLEEAEKMLLKRALEKTRGNQSQAARLLNISRDALRYKIRKFNLS
jgi:PAS domain S-box-containing protein